jgi:recombinational DNA repair protein RecR
VQEVQGDTTSLEILVKLVKKIPGIGVKIAAALEFLMGLADIACPVG